ncbi:unnamed protein product, partial [Penicillium discolor]
MLACDDQPMDGDPPLADEDDHHDPPGDLAQDRQPDESGAGEELVRDRIPQLAEVADDVVATCEVAVDPVGRDGDDEEDGGDPAHGEIGEAVRPADEQEDEEHHGERDARHRDG